MNDNNGELRITARLTDKEATLLRELSNRTGKSSSTLVRLALEHYYQGQTSASQTTTTEAPTPEQYESIPIVSMAENSVANLVADDNSSSPSPIENALHTDKINPSPTHLRSTKVIDYATGVRVLTASFDPNIGLFDDGWCSRPGYGQ
ncbi:hypothetical protein CCP3SC1_160004 [Gammaproteobacteria bacterium]